MIKGGLDKADKGENKPGRKKKGKRERSLKEKEMFVKRQ